MINARLTAIFKLEDRITAAHTHSSYWQGALRGERLGEGLGDADYQTLAAMSLEAFDEAHGRPAKPSAPAKRKAPEPAPAPRRRPTTPAQDAAAIAVLTARIDARLGPPPDAPRIGKLSLAEITAAAASSESSPERTMARELLQRQASASPHPQKTMNPEQRAMIDRAKGSSLT